MSKKISDYIVSDYGNNWGTKTLHVLSLEKLDDYFFQILDQEITKICFGKKPRDLSAVKKTKKSLTEIEDFEEEVNLLENELKSINKEIILTKENLDSTINLKKYILKVL